MTRLVAEGGLVTPKSRARDKSAAPDGIVRVTCEVSFEDGSMDARAAGVLEEAIREACGEAFPTKRIAGLWVHEKAGTPPLGRRRREKERRHGVESS